MTAATTITMDLATRKVAFDMLFDPDFYCDISTLYFLKNKKCEPEVCHLMSRAVHEGDTVVDGGASIGFYSLFLSQLVGPTGKVYAFEPGAQSLAKLRANLKVNQIDNVIVDARPLWSSEADVLLHMAQDPGTASLAKSPTSLSKTHHRAIALAQIVKKVRLVKLDVEGAEHNVLQGSDCWPSTCPFVVTEINSPALKRMGSSPRMLRKFMRKRAYEMFLLHASDDFPTLVPIEVDVEGSELNLNVLFSTMDEVAKLWPSIKVQV